MNKTPTILHNLIPTPNHSMSIQLVGKPPNYFGVGARITAYVKDHRMIDEVRSGGSYCSQSDLRLHFGLGSATQADKIKIRWSDGSMHTLKDVPGDRRLVIRQEECCRLATSSFRLRRPSLFDSLACARKSPADQL